MNQTSTILASTEEESLLALIANAIVEKTIKEVYEKGDPLFTIQLCGAE